MDCSQVVNPYGDGKSAGRIVKVLKDIVEPQDLVRKRFKDLSKSRSRMIRPVSCSPCISGQ